MLKITPNTAQPAEMILQIKETIAIGLPPSLGSGSDRSAPLLREQAAFFPVFLEELDSLFSVYQISLSFASIHCTEFVHERSPFTLSGDLFFSDICLLDRERFTWEGNASGCLTTYF